jgi:zinc protease
MKNNFSFSKLTIALIVLFISLSATVSAQTPPEPYRESLLNGLKVLTWYEPNNPKVYVKLRIHSGAAFDPVGEAGTMALLSDVFFPEDELKTFFVDELEGELSVSIDQDSITISASGNASEYDRIISVLQSAILSTQITDENVNRLRANRLKAISEGANSPSKIADRMVLSRLLGTFPYARSANGEIESLPKIDRIDLQFARERLLKADNATVTIVGGVPDSKMLRSLRQKLGSWIKSDKPISQAFSQPDPPVAKTLIFDTGANENAEIRLAVSGVARSDNNYAAAMILSMIANERIRSSLSESANTKHIAHVLPGVFILSASVPNDKASQSIATAKQILNELATKEPNTNEFEKAKSSFLKFFSQQISNTKTLADFYLDRDTFKIQATPQAALKAIEALKPSDVQRVATRLFGNSSFAIVAVGNLSQLKDELSRNGNAIEIFGEKPVPQPTPKDDKKNPTQTLVLKPVGKP